MAVHYEYRIYVGDTPGPMLSMAFESGKVIVTFSAKLIRELRRIGEKPPPEKGRIQVVRLYGESVGRVYDAFRFSGLKPGTATVYARYIGKLFNWMAVRGLKKLTPKVVCDFLDFLVESREPRSDQQGSGVHHVAHYAVQKFLKLSLHEDIAALILPPDQPEPKPTTSAEDLHSLFDRVRSISDLLMLTATNVVGVSTAVAAKLKWDDFGPGFEYVIVGAGEDAYKKEIDPAYAEILSELAGRTEGPYLLGDSGASLPEPVPVAKRSLQYRFRRVAKRSGIPEWTTLTTTRKAEAIDADALRRVIKKRLPGDDKERQAADGGTG